MADIKKKKTSKVGFEKRVRDVQVWILLGYSTFAIINKIKTDYKVSERQAYKYHKRAFELFKEENAKNIEERKAYHLELRRMLLKRLKEDTTIKGISTALRVADSMARIEGLGFPPQQEKEKREEEEEQKATMMLPDGTEIEI